MPTSPTCMAASRTAEALGSLTCAVCSVTVRQTPGSRRTICPHCGHFYDPNDAHAAGAVREPRAQSQAIAVPSPSRSQRGRRTVPPQLTIRQPTQQTSSRLPTLKERNSRVNADSQDIDSSIGQGREKSNAGRLQTIAQFFQNLGSSRNSNRSKSSDLPSPQSEESSLESLRTLQSPHSRHNIVSPSSEASTSPQSKLPPIASESHSRLLSSDSLSPAPSPGRPSPIPINNQNRSRNTNLSTQQLRALVKDAEESGVWNPVLEFYAITFESFSQLNASFKRDPTKEYRSIEDPGIKFDLVYNVFEILENLPQDAQRHVLKSIINSLLKDRKPHTKDDLRAYIILLINPQFDDMGTYVIFAHLLRQMASLSDQDHHYLVHWLKRISLSCFRCMVRKLHNFISCRLFPPKPQDLPPMAKCTWWIPSATKVLALLNASNNLLHPPLISYMEFYNSTLDHLDLMAEYYTWQNPSAHPGFSFCQYPFVLSITAKRSILQRDSEQQMIIMARRSLVAKVQRRQMPDIGMLFLNITVRRAHLVSDSLNEIAVKQHDLKKKLKVTFAGEPGLDMGGLTKEWFLLLVRQIFLPDYGMFIYDKTAHVFWFSSAPCENYQEFNLVGVLMGLAVYNSIILDIHFPPICYKKLLSPAVVPYNNPTATVGIANTTLSDLKETMPDLARGLQDLLDYEGNVEEDFGLTFQTSVTEFGEVKAHALKPGGENITVTNNNRKEYVQLYVDFLLNKSIKDQFQAFYHGFHSVCASNALIMLRPEEVELLVCGSPTLDLMQLKKVTVYDGYTAQDSPIKNFWEFVSHMTPNLQKRLLLFTTGSDRVPIGGMAEMQFKITRVDKTDMLPMAHTCFNQLVLPAYKSRKTLKQKLLIAIENAEGFGLE